MVYVLSDNQHVWILNFCPRTVWAKLSLARHQSAPVTLFCATDGGGAGGGEGLGDLSPGTEGGLTCVLYGTETEGNLTWDLFATDAGGGLGWNLCGTETEGG